jgi:hypothetical protein
VRPTGSQLIHEVGKRILRRFYEQQGAFDVELSAAARIDPIGVDMRRRENGTTIASKVKVDTYCGTDPAKIADRNLVFYRSDTSSYAFEAIADSATRAPGWVMSSMADELLYYRVAIARPEDEVAVLLNSPDGVFFSELGVEHDDLRLVPMRELRAWFEQSNDRYMSRPVISGDRSAWYRIVPFADVESAIKGVRLIGPVYKRLR